MSASERGWPDALSSISATGGPKTPIEWLVRVFAFREITRATGPDGRLIVTELEGPAGGTVMVATLDDAFRARIRGRAGTTRLDDIAPYPWPAAVTSLIVNSVDDHWCRSCDEGATILDPPRDAADGASGRTQPWTSKATNGNSPSNARGSHLRHGVPSQQ